MRPGWVIAALFVLSGCASVEHWDDVSHEIGECRVTNPDQIEAFDIRTGYPLFSTPHPYNCKLDPKTMAVVWESEAPSSASLGSVLSNLPVSAIQNGIPKATAPY